MEVQMSSDKIDPGDELRIINDMLARTRRRTAEAGDFFIAWGVIILLALGIMWGLIHFAYYEYIWPVWFLAIVIGAGYSVWKGRKLERKARVTTYVDTAITGTWIALGIAFLFLIWLGVFAGLYSYSPLMFICAVLTGCGVFITGILLSVKMLVWTGVGWWLGAVVIAFWFNTTNGIGLYMLFLVVGYLLPGIYLKRSWK
jgi:hypothetical protein